MEIIRELTYNENWKSRKETKRIVLHHAEASTCTIHDINKWHFENGWDGGCGYNFLVRKDGNIYEGRPIYIIGAHTQMYNYDSIGICFEGNFEIETMEEIQRLAGIELIKYIQGIYGKLIIFRHKDLMPSECPGKNFPESIILDGSNFQQEHWAEKHYQILVENGIKITDKRFEDGIKRGEVFALLSQLLTLAQPRRTRY